MKFIVFINSIFELKQNEKGTAHEILFLGLKEELLDAGYKIEKHNCNTFFGKRDFPIAATLDVFVKPYNSFANEKIYFTCSILTSGVQINRVRDIEGEMGNEAGVKTAIQEIMEDFLKVYEGEHSGYKGTPGRIENGKLIPALFEKEFSPGVWEKTWIEYRY